LDVLEVPDHAQGFLEGLKPAKNGFHGKPMVGRDDRDLPLSSS